MDLMALAEKEGWGNETRCNTRLGDRHLRGRDGTESCRAFHVACGHKTRGRERTRVIHGK